jgi:hypothetical protein
MLTEKDQRFTDSLIQATMARQIWWRPLPVADRYKTSFVGDYHVTVDKHGQDYSLKVTDGRERELLSFTSTHCAKVKELFEVVRRALMNVDEVLDKIIEQIAVAQVKADGRMHALPADSREKPLRWKSNVAPTGDAEPLVSSVSAA